MSAENKHSRLIRCYYEQKVESQIEEFFVWNQHFLRTFPETIAKMKRAPFIITKKDATEHCVGVARVSHSSTFLEVRVVSGQRKRISLFREQNSHTCKSIM